MNKYRIVILVFVVVAAIGGYIYYHNTSLSKVTLDSKGSTFTLYNSVDKKPVAEISSSTTLKLRDGYYCGVTKGSKYDDKPLCFSVYKSDVSYTFDANYSQSYLSKLLLLEKPAISSVINSTYKNIINDYTVCTGSLYVKGDIYGAAIVQNPAYANDNSDIYRIVLKKKASTWEIIKNPVIVLDKKTFADIPFDVLRAVNTSDACQPTAVSAPYTNANTLEPITPIERPIGD